MDVRMRIAVASDDLNVAAFCREQGISRQTFYEWRRRFRSEGLAGLEAKSRAPRTSPRQIGPDVEDSIVSLRKELEGLGVDFGPDTIQWHLERRGSPLVPSRATIWRTLVRRGFVVPEPRKRPKSSYQRFQASAPNELWQADAIDWAIAVGTVKILSFLDDHSRVALAAKAVPEATSEATWETFCQASEVWGLPLGQLSDNGLNFSGKLRGFEVHFERQLRSAGVVPKTSRPYHPQTCGKVERFQQTLKKWLRRQPLAADLAELQAQIDAFVEYYNNERPHRSLNRRTPAEAWAATPPAINLGVALPSPALSTTVVVSPDGVVRARPYRIHVGVEWADRQATVHHDESHAAVFIGHQLVRALVLDRSRSYQPSGRRRGGPKRARLP